jgi:hypothetical protein
MILKRQLQKSTQTNKAMKSTIIILALKALLCPNFGRADVQMDTIVKPEFQKTTEGVRFVYRNYTRIKMDEEIYDQVWYSIEILGELKCYQFTNDLYFFATKTGEYLVVETDFRRINFGTELFREMNWKELVQLKNHIWKSDTCQKLRIRKNSSRKNFVFERQHVRVSLIGIRERDTENWQQKIKALKVLN